jgi:hypothetical protein
MIVVADRVWRFGGICCTYSKRPSLLVCSGLFASAPWCAACSLAACSATARAFFNSVHAGAAYSPQERSFTKCHHVIADDEMNNICSALSAV